LAVSIFHRVEDLWYPAIERIGDQFARMSALRAPFGRAGDHPAKLPSLHRPRSQLRHVVNLVLRDRDGGEVDRSELANEVRPDDTQLHLRRLSRDDRTPGP